MNLEEIMLLDLRIACIHEAAHTLVANKLGVPARFEVFPSSAKDPRLEKTWVGKTTIHVEPDASARRMIGLAGGIAELIHSEPTADIHEIAYWIYDDANSISETDRQLAGEFTIDDVHRCAALVQSLWRAIEFEAENAFINAQTPD